MPGSREISLERLEQQHSFPGPFIFKAIGPNSPRFVAQATQAATVVLGAHAKFLVSTNESSGGKHVAVTLKGEVQSAQQVLDVWAGLAAVDGIKMVL